MPDTKSSHEAEYTLRYASLSDLNALTRNVIPHVSHDGFHDYFFPQQDAYPEDFYRWWKRYYRNILMRPYSVLLIAEDEHGEMKGLGMWSFARGEKAQVPKGLDIAKDSWFERLQRRVYGWIDRIEDKFRPNRCTDNTALVEWRKTVIGMGQKLWVGEDLVHWLNPEFITFTKSTSKETKKEEMAALAPVVHGWGIKQADADGTSAFALCTINEKAIYEKEGYELVLEIECGPSKCFAMKHRGI